MQVDKEDLCRNENYLLKPKKTILTAPVKWNQCGLCFHSATMQNSHMQMLMDINYIQEIETWNEYSAEQ